MNKITITGRLVRDPEMKTLPNGTEKCRFTVAVDRRHKKDQPAKADFFDCDAWSATGAFVNNWFKKGTAHRRSLLLQRKPTMDQLLNWI